MSNLYGLRQQIARMARTEEDVQAILQELASYDWPSILAEERRLDALAEECKQSQIYQCAKCLERFQRRELEIIDGYDVSGYCKGCAAQIRAVHTHVCLVCQKSYVIKKEVEPDMEICQRCEATRTDYKRLLSHRSRARMNNQPATLTLKQWLATLQHFQERCAYCGRKYQVIEHYIPITLGGATAINNCLPACNKCNIHKKDKLPHEFACLFPAENMRRIREYLKV